MARADVFVLLDNVQFKKNEWQNRNRLRNAQGWQWITVPVLHDHGQMISEVRLNPAVDWRKEHVHSIEQNYAKAPFFKTYWPSIRPVYEKDWATLADLNIALIRVFVDILGIRTRLVVASELDIASTKTQRLIDICKVLESDAYLAGAGGADYMDFDLMRSSGLAIQVQEYKHPVYPQLWSRQEGDFQPFMSVLDLVMNCGEKSLSILQGIH
jgi:hypothetical protein